jgi:hypothetical protein
MDIGDNALDVIGIYRGKSASIYLRMIIGVKIVEGIRW